MKDNAAAFMSNLGHQWLRDKNNVTCDTSTTLTEYPVLNTPYP